MPGGVGAPPALVALYAGIKALFGSSFVFVRGFGTQPDGSFHSGIDLSAATGTPIRAVSDGVITYAGYAGNTLQGAGAQAGTPGFNYGGGNVVNISAGGLIQSYAHMSAFAVKSGQTVHKGDIIGYVGATGLATGPHLHFGLWDPSTNKFVDPAPFIRLQEFSASLSFWNGWISFPQGHTLTAADVDQIIAILDQHHAFQAVNAPPLLGQLAENAARDQTRAILMQHVGEAWSPALAQSLQTQFFGAAKAAVDNPAQHLADLAGKLFDPGVWIRILALLIGMAMAAYGGASVLKASA